MKWRDLVLTTAQRAGVSVAVAERVLRAFREVVGEQLLAGVDVRVPGIVRLSSRWTPPREVRHPDGRRLRLDGRFVARALVSSALRARLADRTPQTWRDPRQQSAWRLAQTLVGDLAAYHPQVQPRHIHAHSTWIEVDAALRAAFPSAWDRIVATWSREVPPEVRGGNDHLLHAARLTWPAPAA